MKKLLTILLTSCLATAVYSQTPPPSTDIYLYELEEINGEITIAKGRNLTHRAAYDNQPSFFNNDYILYTSYQEDGQTDILMINLQNDQTTNLTKSKDSEYSPTILADNKSFAVVRVEEDNTQRLWKYSFNADKQPQVIFEKIAPVGYFAIIDENVLMFVLGQPASLVLANMTNLNQTKITDNVARTIRAIPGTSDFTFEKRDENGVNFIYHLDQNQATPFKLIEKPNGASDWTITSEGTYITSVGSKLMAYNPKFHKQWQEIIDLGDVGKKGITRMAVNEQNNRLAIVINN